MVKWIRGSGSVIELEDTENLNNYAKENGWTQAKRKRRTNAEIKNDNSGDTGKTDIKRD